MKKQAYGALTEEQKNLLLISMCAVVFLGTLFSLIINCTSGLNFNSVELILQIVVLFFVVSYFRNLSKKGFFKKLEDEKTEDCSMNEQI